MVKPDFDRFSCDPLSGRAALDEVCGNSGALSLKNNLSNLCCDPKDDSLHNYAVCYTVGLTVDHDIYCTLGGVHTFSSHSFHLRNIPYALGQLVPK